MDMKTPIVKCSQNGHINRAIVNLFLIVTFALLPFFNDFPLFSSSTTLKSPTSIFVVLSVVGFFINFNKIVRFNTAIKIGLLFVCAVFVSGMFNFYISLSLSSIEISGSKQLAKSFGLMIFVVYSFLWISCVVTTQERLTACIRGILIGCTISLAVGALEYLSYGLSQGWAVALNGIIEPLIHVRPQDIGPFRMRSTAFEPSYYGMYIAFVFPFLFYLAIYETKFKYWMLLLFTLLALFLSKSRTGQISVGIEIILFLYFASKFKLITRIGFLRKSAIVLVTLGVVLLGTVSLSSTRNMEENISNVTRFSSQVAAINVFRDFPIFGVGIGLAGAYLPDYYPDFARYSWEIREWCAPLREENLSTPVFAMIPRLFAETGLAGVTTFMILNIYILIRLRNICLSKNRSSKRKAISLAIGLSIVGQLVASFGVDSYAIYGYWFSLGLGAGFLSICKSNDEYIPSILLKNYRAKI